MASWRRCILVWALLGLAVPASSQSVRSGRVSGASPIAGRPAVIIPSLQPSQGLAGQGLSLAPSASLPSAAGPSVQERVSLIQEFRRLASLPPLSAATVAALETSGPRSVAEVQVSAAKDFLAGINPNFSAEAVEESRALDSPELLAIKKAVRAARQTLAEARVSGLRESFSKDGRVDPEALNRAFTGSSRLSAMAGRIPGPNGKALLDLIADGAPRQAMEQLSRLKKYDKNIAQGQGREAAKALAQELGSAPQSRDVAEFSGRLEAVRGLLAKRRYAEALAGAKALLAEVKVSGLRDATRRFFGMEAAGLESAAREKGSDSIYGNLGVMSPARLAEHVTRLAARDPGAYVGDILPRSPVRVQCHGDCAIQQAYNHSKLSLVSEQMPYGTFLSAVESLLDKPARRDGLNSVEEGIVLSDFGLARVSRGNPKTADELVELIRRHGSLMLAVRWGPLESFRDLHGNHAVILQGAYREDGLWHFVMIDSNHSRPQVFSFEELGLLGMTGYDSVEVLPDGPRLPEELRGIADPEARMRKAVNIFYGRFGAVRAFIPWYKRLVFVPLNRLLEKFGREPIEPKAGSVVDGNLIPISKAPKALQTAVRRGLRLPAEAFVTAQDGRRFLNRLVIDRLLDGF
ncbi:MAG: hypothetical protein HZB91_11385 [Elusimicrobia bacterium]|nr:hypothetical protein [Elusimicrobiota bacterium]